MLSKLSQPMVKILAKIVQWMLQPTRTYYMYYGDI